MSYHGSLADGDAAMRSAQEYLRAIAAARQARDETPSGKGASLLCITTSDGSYPIASPAVFALLPVELDAADDEGSLATPTPDPDQEFYGVNVGSSAPPEGTLVVCHAVGGAWVFRYD